MKRSRFKREGRRRLAFRDRKAALATILGHLGASYEDAAYLRVIALVGFGGIGKSRLLDEITTRTVDRYPDIKILRVSLEAENAGTALVPLKAIRDRLKFDCLLFDCAILTYWAAIGQPFALIEGGSLSKSFVVKAVEAGVGVTGLALPLSFAGDMYERAKRRLTRRRLYDKSEFEEIDLLRNSPSDILERLPHFLGLDIDKRLSQHTLFLYDSYEKQSRQTLEGQSGWLREFIGTLDRGIHIVASRESLRWPDASWGDVLAEIVVDALPEVDCREMLQQETDAPEDAVNKMVLVSRCIPFFVEACIDAYQALKADQDPIDVTALPQSQAEATSHLIRHLPPSERDLVIALATLQFFDEIQFRMLLRELNIPLAFSAFNDVRRLFFVEPHDSAKRIYKTHDILSDFVRSEPNLRHNRIVAADAASRMLALRIETDGAPAGIFPLFFGLICAISTGDAMPTKIIEAAIDVGYRLYDVGFWRELIAIAGDVDVRKGESGVIVAQFFKALSLRRIHSISDAEKLLAELQINQDRLGKHKFSLELEIAYLREISGHYADARERFSELYSRCKPFDPTNRIHVKSLLYHADMFIMDGLFQKGSELLLEGCELLEPRDRINWAEFVRHRGHAFRYSFLLDEAETLYLRALSAVSDVPSLAAKLTGNLAECQCWNSPERAIENARIALELNERLCNLIEVGKNHASLCLAFTVLGSHEDAKIHYELGIRSALNVGYPSGILFCEVAGCVAAADTPLVLEQRVSQLQHRIASLGAYRHQLLIPLLLNRNEGMAAEIVAECDWIEPDTIVQRARSLAMRIRSVQSKSSDL